MLIQTFVLNDLSTNTYVVGEPEGEVMIIDPSAEAMEEVIDYVHGQHLTVKYIVNTHAHFDHVIGNESLRRHFGAPLFIHEKDLEILLQLPVTTRRIFGRSVDSNPPEYFLHDNDILQVGNYRFRVLETPGHSPGGICLYEEKEGVLFTGDTLFAGTIGRTDLQGGNASQLFQSLKDKLWSLPDEVVIYPGHEEDSTIGDERMHNPFFYF